jgi:hypothetical protein
LSGIGQIQAHRFFDHRSELPERQPKNFLARKLAEKTIAESLRLVDQTTGEGCVT